MADTNNFETALRAEMKNVIRYFHRYDVSRWKMHRPSRAALDGGEFRYSHPNAPGVCFTTRSAAARHALRVSA